jgi:nitrogen fixation protein NifQ
MTMNTLCYEDLMSRAANPGDAATLALAGVIAGIWQREAPRLGGEALGRLFHLYFPGAEPVAALPCRHDAKACHVFRMDEYDDLVALLLEHRSRAGEDSEWLAHAVAAACMDDNHLWQDMGLPSRELLSQLMARCVPALAARNVGDMKWKKFFYRQLCERAEVPICKSPHCAECCDYSVCFGPDD